MDGVVEMHKEGNLYSLPMAAAGSGKALCGDQEGGGTKSNTADILTKSSEPSTISKHMTEMSLETHEPNVALQKTIH